jgi:hypothetical protein
MIETVKPDFRDTWNLCDDIISFILPRIKLYRSLEGSWPGYLDNYEQWAQILDKIIAGLELAQDRSSLTEEENKIIKRAGKLLITHFFSLWN